MRARQIAFSMANTIIWFLLAGVLFFAAYSLNLGVDAQYAIYPFIAAIVILVLAILNLIFACLACQSKFCSIGLLILGIIGIPFAGIFGILNLVSYTYSKKYLEGEYIMSSREKRKMRREERKERREEEKERLRYDSDYRRFVHQLKKRKLWAILKNFFLLLLTSIHSIPGFLLAIEFNLIGAEYQFLIFIAIYVVLCPLTLFIKGIDPFFKFDYTESKTTSTTEYIGDDFWGDAMYKTEHKTENNNKTGAFFTLQGLLFYLVGWMVCFTQVIGLLVSIFAKYNNRHLVCGKSVKKIPSRYLKFGRKMSMFTFFLFSFVIVEDDYLDYLEDIFQ